MHRNPMSPMESVTRAKDRKTRIGKAQVARKHPSRIAAIGRSLANSLIGLEAGPTKFVTLDPETKKIHGTIKYDDKLNT